jgi:hypothetical protein
MLIVKGTSNANRSKETDLSGVVPKRLNEMSNIDEMTTDKTKAYMYIDNNGTDKKISLEELTSSLITALPRYAGRIE